MGSLILPVTAQRERKPLFTGYVVAVVGFGLIALATHLGQFQQAAAAKPAMWLMLVLAVLADAQTYVTPGRKPGSIIAWPSICFTFAILLCWGLGPAIVAQSATAIIMAFRIRSTPWRTALSIGQYAVAFSAAYVVLAIGDPNPLGPHSAMNAFRDVASCLIAAAVWIAVYGTLVLAAGWMRMGPSWWRRARGSIGYQALFTTALLLLSPMLAVTAHISAWFVPFIFVPLFAVERMARLSAERERAARMDPLTGLANRAGLQTQFGYLRDAFLSRAPGRPEGHLALLLLDLDRFKHVNDTLGHDAGDRLLVAVAHRLRDAVPAAGTVARLGGDEFAIVVPNLSDPGQARGTACRIIDALAEPVLIDGMHIDIAGSVGIAEYPEHGDDFATLMRHADVAMYDAKQRGGAVAVYRREADHNSPELLSLLTDFRRALLTPGCTEIAVHYQPQVALDSGEPVGVEALVRWHHPSRGPISPTELLRVVERTTVMQLLTQHVINQVVAQLAAWSRDGIDLRASLNVSIRDLYSGDIVSHLASQLARHGVAADRIQLEITESALMADPARVLDTLAQLSELGVAISLDDFGTGYSSLQHLRRLPLAEIKVDRSFVGTMAGNGDDFAIVRSTVELARALGLRVVAEGVEDERTWELLAAAGCSVAQGWFTARAMPAHEVKPWLAARAQAGAALQQPAPARRRPVRAELDPARTLEAAPI